MLGLSRVRRQIRRRLVLVLSSCMDELDGGSCASMIPFLHALALRIAFSYVTKKMM